MLKNKTAVVTGGTRGIGYEVVKTFLENGAKVALLGSKEESVNKALAQLKAENGQYEIIGFHPDLADPEQVAQTFQNVKEAFGSLDILVNNAGISARDVYKRQRLNRYV